ncbi:MAG TPA: PAS domain S-box protein [Gemmataceae bacterium]|nr:PAS domain S-box protein [Gemmataceae bacterium]
MHIQLTMFKKGLILVSVPLLTQLAFLGLFAEMQGSNAEVQGWFAHTKEVIAQTHALRGTLMEAETGARGLIGAGDPAAAQTFERARRRLPDELVSLKSLVGDNPEQEARAAALGEKASQLMEWWAESKRLAAEGSPSQTALRERGRTSQARMDDLRDQLSVFLLEEERLDEIRQRNLARSLRLLQLLLFGGGVVALLSTSLLAFIFSRGVSRRLAILTNNAQRLAARKALLPPVVGSDEIARVDQAFHLMSQELARSENALRAQTQILQSILDSMADGVVVADEKGRFLLFNPAAKQILGVGLTDTPPDAWADSYGIHLPDKKTPCPAEQFPLVQAIQGKTVDAAELWVSNPAIPGGVWISLNARPLRGTDGQLQGGVVVFHDVSQRKCVEESLRESEKRFRLLVESVQDYAILMLDPEGRVTSWNPGAERIKGYKADEIVGKHFSCFYPDEMRERGWPKIELQRASAEGRFEDEGWRVRKDGSRFWANAIMTAIRDESGGLRGFAKVTRDLTERRKAEESIHRFNEELEQRVVERTASLDQANRDLAQKNQENELFVYSVSHDLRSPLVNLEGFSEELSLVCQDLRELLTDKSLSSSVRQRGKELLDGDMAESIRFIRTGVRRLSNIIDGLLQLSRAGRVVCHFQPVEVKVVVSRVVESMHLTVTERGATVRLAEIPSAWADPVAVEQIFANLIGNALNYLDPLRPGVIEVGSEETSGDEGTNGQTARRTFYVKDNGLGIPAAHQAKIFQAFQRLHPTAAKGEGIGLSLVRRLVERLGGRIWFQSTEGIGSTFFVTLAGLPAHEFPQPFRSNGTGTREQEQLHDSAAVLDPVG